MKTFLIIVHIFVGKGIVMKKQKKPICMILLIVANIGVFFWLSLSGQTEDALYMYQNGAMYVPSFIEGEEYFRIFSSMFMHFGFDHLINNMLTLLVVGRRLESAAGHIRFLIIYIISGIGGNALSIVWELYTENYVISAGASGAIFGLTGALLTLTILNRGYVAGVTRGEMLIIIGISLYNGFANPGVNNAAHMGGLITGFLITFLLCPKGHSKRGSNVRF